MKSRILLALLPVLACGVRGAEPESGNWSFVVSVVTANTCGEQAPRPLEGTFQLTVTDDGEFVFDHYSFPDPLDCTYGDDEFDCAEVSSPVSNTGPDGKPLDLDARRDFHISGTLSEKKLVGTQEVRIECAGSGCSLYLQSLGAASFPCAYTMTFAAEAPGA